MSALVLILDCEHERAETLLRLRALARQPARAPSRGNAQRLQILTLRSVNYKKCLLKVFRRDSRLVLQLIQLRFRHEHF
jgi:hypothetical protein